MQISGMLPVFLCAGFGGLLTELLKWYRLRESPNLPHYKSSVLYWGVTVCMILAAGVLGILYGVTERSAIMVMNIGISAPLLLKAMAEVHGQQEKKVRVGKVSVDVPQTPGFHQDREAKAEVGVSDEADSPFWKFLAWH